MRRFLFLLFVLTVSAAAQGEARAADCCVVVALDMRGQAVTAIDRASAKLFSFTVQNPATFRTIRIEDSFNAPLAQAQRAAPFSAGLGPNTPDSCCTLTTDIGGAGQALKVLPYEVGGVAVILTELRRTAGNTVTARWQYVNGTDQPVKFPAKGCVGMGCTYTLAEDVYLLDLATRTKHDVLRDTTNKAVAQRYESAKLTVGPHQILETWAKFEAPPASSSTASVVLPGLSEPFEDMPVAP